MELNGELKEDFEKLKEQGEFKDDIEDVEKQALNLIEIAIDKDKYKGIVGNYQLNFNISEILILNFNTKY